MTGVLVLVSSIVVLGLVVAAFSHLHQDDANTTDIVPTNSCSICVGIKEKCRQECMMEAATKPIEYYDDEELDRFVGRPSTSYTDEEAELFRDVLYTMRQKEVAGWGRSLTLRGINIPDQVKDELVMLIDG